MTNEEILQQAKDHVASLATYENWNALLLNCNNKHYIEAKAEEAAIIAMQSARDEGYSQGHTEALAGDGL